MHLVLAKEWQIWRQMFKSSWQNYIIFENILKATLQGTEETRQTYGKLKPKLSYTNLKCVLFIEFPYH